MQEQDTVQKPATHGAAYASNYDGYRDRIERFAARTKPIHAEVARLQAQGLGGEQAWAEAL
jgi:hypothetical protein